MEPIDWKLSWTDHLKILSCNTAPKKNLLKINGSSLREEAGKI